MLDTSQVFKNDKKQILKFRRIKDSVYYCNLCVSNSLPFSNMTTSKLISLNQNDTVVVTENKEITCNKKPSHKGSY